MLLAASTAAAAASAALYLYRRALYRRYPPLGPLARPPMDSNTEVHRDGQPWTDPTLTRPPWIHRCRPQTGRWVNTEYGRAWIERCPCGGFRENGSPWGLRNSGRPRAYRDETVYVQWYQKIDP
jgi:hypothetical protein